MTIAVTGATGRLGRHTVDALLRRDVPAEQIVAIGRNPEKLAELSALGVVTRWADYEDPAALDAALDGVERLFFVSGSEVGQRIPQHRNVVDAAVRARVDLIAYTSAPKVDTSTMAVAPDHKATEAHIRESGLPFVFLRNSWYMANYTDMAAAYVESGEVLGAAQDGRISAATHADFADAAAVVLIDDVHEHTVYELGGDTAFTMSDFAQALSESSGQNVEYKDLSEGEYVAALRRAGVPAEAAEVFASSDRGVARGELHIETGDLSRLIGRPTVDMPTAVAAVVANPTS